MIKTNFDYQQTIDCKYHSTGGISVPAIPNKPLNSNVDDDPMVEILLRSNREIGFTENEIFDPSKVVYEPSYQASQEHSPAFQTHMRAMLLRLQERFPVQTRIVEVGCGKGAFMTLLEEAGYQNVKGYDPTYDGTRNNVARQYLSNSDTLDADLYIMRHVLEHIVRPHEFVRLIRDISVNRDRPIYIEVPCFDWIKNNHSFYDITYEHVNYFSLKSLRAMFDNKVILSGHAFSGQYIYVIAYLSDLSDAYARSYSHGEWLREDFQLLFPTFKSKLLEIEKILGADRKLYLWRAGTKGCLFLHHAKQNGLLKDRTPYVIDINQRKIGTYLPGSKLPVKSKDDLLSKANATDLILVANPNYMSEIREMLRGSNLENIEMISL